MEQENSLVLGLTPETAWRPLIGEPVDAYAAFSSYFNSGGTFTYEEVAKNAGVSAGVIGAWRKKWLWDERVNVCASDLARGRVANIKDMEKLQAVVIADGFEDYVKIRQVWSTSVDFVIEALANAADPDKEGMGVNIKDLAAALKSLTGSKADIDKLGRAATLLPASYMSKDAGESRDFSGGEQGYQRKPRQLDWGGEGINSNAD